jgi:aspartate kinase
VPESDAVHQDSLINQFEGLVSVICEDHIQAAKTYIRDPSLQESVSKDIEKECKEILEYRLAAKQWELVKNLPVKSKDRIVSYGEKLSCRFMTALLRDRVSIYDKFCVKD